MTFRAGNAGRSGTAAQTALGTRAAAGQARDGRWTRSGWLVLLPAFVTGAIVAIGITGPSYWRDEAATVAAVHRPAGALVRMLGHVDAVHGAYYLLLWPLARELGTGELVLRLPSLLAMAVAAAVIAATGRRLATPAVGVTAGLVFAIAPSVTEYGQMARSCAVVTMVAAIASYALVRALEPDATRVRWPCYGVSVAVLGALNIFALLLIPAHGISMRVLYRGRGPARRLAFRRWLGAAGAGFAINIPLIVLAARQRDQIRWLPYPSPGDVGNVLDLLGPPWMTMAIMATGLAAVAVTSVRRRGAAAGPGAAQPGPRAAEGWGAISALCVPWLIVPPAVLLLASLISTPVYDQRYILFCTPAAALMTAVALEAVARMPGPRLLGRILPAAALALVAALGLGMQVQYRQPWGHADDIRAADAIIARAARPGDVMMYTWPVFMPISAAYPYGLATLPDIQVRQAPIPSGTLAGTTVPRAVIRQRIGATRRLWIIQVSQLTSERKVLTGMHLRLARTWRTSDMWLQLYVRDTQGSGRAPR